MSIKVYEYNKCSTCVKALKFLATKSVKFEKINIIEKPPTLKELKTMLGHLKAGGGGLKNLFNTSGVQYRELILTANKGAVGFNPEVWIKLF